MTAAQKKKEKHWEWEEKFVHLSAKQFGRCKQWHHVRYVSKRLTNARGLSRCLSRTEIYRLFIAQIYESTLDCAWMLRAKTTKSLKSTRANIFIIVMMMVMIGASVIATANLHAFQPLSRVSANNWNLSTNDRVRRCGRKHGKEANKRIAIVRPNGWNGQRTKLQKNTHALGVRVSRIQIIFDISTAAVR